MAQTPKRPAGAPKSKQSNKKVANSLVTLSSAAVMAIYAAGYARTRTAAAEIEMQGAARRPVVPAPAPADRPATEIANLTAAAVPAAPAESAAAAAPTADAPTIAASSLTKNAAADETPSVATVAATDSSKPAVTAPGPVTSAAPAVAAAAEATAPTAAAPAAKEQAAPAAQAPAVAKTSLVKYKDGTYRGWGRSAHGEILAFVNIQGGRIVRAGIDKCQTRWSCTLVEHLGPQVVSRQSAEVDFVGGATQSGNAFYYGVVGALEQASQALLEAPADTEGK